MPGQFPFVNSFVVSSQVDTCDRRKSLLLQVVASDFHFNSGYLERKFLRSAAFLFSWNMCPRATLVPFFFSRNTFSRDFHWCCVLPLSIVYNFSTLYESTISEAMNSRHFEKAERMRIQLTNWRIFESST